MLRIGDDGLWKLSKQVTCGELVFKRQQRGVDNFDALLQFLADFADEIMGLRKSTLQDVVNSTRKSDVSAWSQAHNFFARHLATLTVGQQELLDDWELLLCNVDKDTEFLDSTAFQKLSGM